MSGKSKKYRELIMRIEFLKRTLLPQKICNNLIGNFTQKEQDMISSFALLSHAELENYFENMAMELVNKGIFLWATKGRISVSIAALLAHFDLGEELHLNNLQNYLDLNARLHKAASKYEKEIIRKNHGIKSENILKIYLRLGIDKNVFSSMFLNGLDTYGENRGEQAHKSIKVRRQLNPNDMIREIDFLILELDTIDAGFVQRLKI